jgi:tripartite-type tricarboxylate transporter receptor subunit TctC
MITRRRAIGMAATAAFASCLARRTLAQTSSTRDSSAQNWPTRFVRLIVPFPPGGGTDAIARVIAGKLSDMWGQQMVVENRGGASTNIGTEAVVRAEADGYTMLLQSLPLAVNRFLFP